MGTVPTRPLIYVSGNRVYVWQYSPDSIASQHAAGEEHAYVDTCGLYDGTDSHNHAKSLHESKTAKSISNSSLSQST